MKISEYCKNKRMQDGLSMQQYAKKIGVAYGYLYGVENGKHDSPSPLQLSNLVTKYDIDPKDAFNFDGLQNIDVSFKEKFNYYLNNEFSPGSRPLCNVDGILDLYENKYLNTQNFFRKFSNSNGFFYDRVYSKDDTLLLACVIWKISTFNFKVDKRVLRLILNDIVSKITRNIALPEKYSNYEILLLTSNEEVYEFVREYFKNGTPNLKNISFMLGYSRSKRPIKEPICLSDVSTNRNEQEYIEDETPDLYIIKEKIKNNETLTSKEMEYLDYLDWSYESMRK